jgi:hypothetical protein
VRERDGETRTLAPEHLADAELMGRVQVRVDETDGDGLDPLALDGVDHRLEARLVELLLHASVPAQPLRPG